MDNINPNNNKSIKNIKFSGTNSEKTNNSGQISEDQGVELGRKALGGPAEMLGQSQVQRQSYDSSAIDPSQFDPEKLTQVTDVLKDLDHELVEKAEDLSNKAGLPYGKAIAFQAAFVNEFKDNQENQ